MLFISNAYYRDNGNTEIYPGKSKSPLIFLTINQLSAKHDHKVVVLQEGGKP
jgi:hypothetical protein